MKNGDKLVVIDDMVLDVRSWKVNHPGGKFLIDHNIGRDISKFFYGGYLLENGQGMKPHTHSNVATHIINSLVIARLETKGKSFNARVAYV